MNRFSLAALAASLLSAACASGPAPQLPTAIPAHAVVGEYIVPPDVRFPALESYRFGGISGLAPVRGRPELLAISDDRENSRVVRLTWERQGTSFTVRATGAIHLQSPPGSTTQIDPEGIAITEVGNILISTEGLGDAEPRTPPSINEYAPDGRFLGELSVPARFYPNERGPLTVGVRANAGFESLTLTPDYRALYTANELPLAQDAEASIVERGAGGQVRILRYVRSETGMGYAPQQQFVYEIAPLDPLPFTPRFVVNGLVELLALRDGELLALERAYVQSDDPQQSFNRIRIYHVRLSGAADVSLVSSLKTGGHKPTHKTLVADLNGMQGLSAALEKLENFEALALVPAGPGNERLLMVASDNNFSDRQVTAFLLLSPRR